MGGSGVYVGSAVDEEGDAVICGDEGCNRCAVDAADTADNKLTADQLNAFGELPSKDALVAQVLGTFLAPISSLAFVLDQIRALKEGPAEEAPAEA